MTDPVDAVAQALIDRLVQHDYAMARDTARDLARAAIDAWLDHIEAPLTELVGPAMESPVVIGSSPLLTMAV